MISYLHLLEQSYLFYQARRYDIRGKKLLSTLGKYYVADTGLRNTRLNRGFRDNLGHQIENIVFIELLRHGYEVEVGDYSRIAISRKTTESKIPFFRAVFKSSLGAISTAGKPPSTIYWVNN